MTKNKLLNKKLAKLLKLLTLALLASCPPWIIDAMTSVGRQVSIASEQARQEVLRAAQSSAETDAEQKARQQGLTEIEIKEAKKKAGEQALKNPQVLEKSRTAARAASTKIQKQLGYGSKLPTSMMQLDDIKEQETPNIGTVLVYLDDYEIAYPMPGAIQQDLVIPLIEETGIIITSGSLLSQVFSYRGKDIEQKKLVNQLQNNFNSEKWIIRKIDKNANLFLLLPKAEYSPEDWQKLRLSGDNKNGAVTTPLEIKFGIKIDHLLRIPEIETAQEKQKAIQNYFASQYDQFLNTASQENLASDFVNAITNDTIFIPKYQHDNLPFFVILLAGHGGYGMNIAGISITSEPGKPSLFQQLLNSLEKKVRLKLFVYFSCYAAGFNAKLIYGELMAKGGTQTYSFAIVSAAAGDMPTATKIISTPQGPTPFNVSYKLFSQEIKKNIVDYQTALLLIFSYAIAETTPYVRPAHSPEWFALSQTDNPVITIGRIKALAHEQNKQPLIIKPYKDRKGIMHDPQKVLISTTTLSFPIVIDKAIKTIPVFISSLPGDATHTFSSITYEGAPFDIADFLGYDDILYGSIKTFVINHLAIIDADKKPLMLNSVAITALDRNIFTSGYKSDGSSYSFSLKTIIAKDLLDAAKAGIVSEVESALTKGADIHYQDKEYGYTALHNAAYEGHLDAAQLLIEKGARINIQDAQGDSPLHHAAERGDTDLVTLLIKHGANRNLKNKENQTPLDLAVKEKHREVAKVLREYINQKSENLEQAKP